MPSTRSSTTGSHWPVVSAARLRAAAVGLRGAAAAGGRPPIGGMALCRSRDGSRCRECAHVRAARRACPLRGAGSARPRTSACCSAARDRGRVCPHLRGVALLAAAGPRPRRLSGATSGRLSSASTATVSDHSWGIEGAVAGLYGYWNDADPIKAHLAAWPLITAALIALALWGLAHRRHDPIAWAVAAAAAFGFLLALGSRSPVTGSLYRTALDHVAMLRSFREPQKGVALLAFGYAYLGGAAAGELGGHTSASASGGDVHLRLPWCCFCCR